MPGFHLLSAGFAPFRCWVLPLLEQERRIETVRKSSPSCPVKHAHLGFVKRNLANFGEFWRTFGELWLGGVQTTPDPNTSAKASRYKWEAYRDTNWWCICYSLPTGAHAFAKVSR